MGALADFAQDLIEVRQRLGLLAAVLPGRVIEQQVRIFGQQGQGVAQLLQALGQALAVHLGGAGQGDGQVGVPAIVDQLEVDAGLLYLAGLAHLGVVETHEFGRLRRVAQMKLFPIGDGLLEPFHQVLESLHQASPPNTSTSLKTHAGDAWPTRITWFGSPLPQLGVPSTLKVLASPTALSLRQNCAEIAR